MGAILAIPKILLPASKQSPVFNWESELPPGKATAVYKKQALAQRLLTDARQRVHREVKGCLNN